MIALKVITLLFALQTGGTVEGPLTDAIEKRLDRIAERIEGIQLRPELFDRLFERMEAAEQSRFAELMQSIRDAQLEREGIIQQLKEFRSERDGILSSLADFRKDRDGLLTRMAGLRADILAQRAEFEGRWTPLSNLVDRLTKLIWKLFWLVVAVAVVGGLIAFLLAWAYYKLLRLVPNISADVLKKLGGL